MSFIEYLIHLLSVAILVGNSKIKSQLIDPLTFECIFLKPPVVDCLFEPLTYSRPSVAPTLMACFPQLVRSPSGVRWKYLIVADLG